MSAANVGVVIATYDSGELLPPLLAGLQEYEPDAPVVVVDDASPSGPPTPDGAEVIVNAENRGYAASCNRGVDALRRHEVDFVAFLNPDVRLTGPSLTELVEEMESRPDVGAATGPLVSPDGRRLPSAWGRTSVRRAFIFAAGLEPVRHRAAAGTMLRGRQHTSHASTVENDLRVDGHVIGGTMMVRMTCLDQVGCFDEEFFLYWEDADLCHRIRAAGWEVRVLPCTPFVHEEDQPGVLHDERRWKWFVEGAHRFGQKHLVPGQATQLEAALDLGRRLRRIRQRG
ncbi:MAG: glycosyltransferase family 2 protein [Nitriliruptorales bacterium]|nr:glycosyltransferase family 2 protein [Nitriliruptorales bacterium]